MAFKVCQDYVLTGRDRTDFESAFSTEADRSEQLCGEEKATETEAWASFYTNVEPNPGCGKFSAFQSILTLFTCYSVEKSGDPKLVES